MNNDTKKSNPLRFDEQSLAAKGYVRSPSGGWHKPATKSNHAVGAGARKIDAEPTGALGSKKEADRPRKSGGTKSTRRKRAAEWIVSLTCYVPRYFDSDNATAATKAIRDELADWLGVDDGDHRIMWEVDQCLTRGTPGVCVKIQYA